MNILLNLVASIRRFSYALFCGLVLLIGVTVSLVTPPFSNPDEGAHYLRSYEVSRGHLINSRDNVGVPIPCDEYQVVGSKYAPIAFFQDVESLARASADCTVQSINSAGVYPPVSYVFSAIGLRVAELFGTTPENRLLTARVFNALASAGLILFGMASIRHYRLILAALVLMPTAVWQRSALTADSLTLAFCFLLVCSLIRIQEAGQPPTRKQFVWLCVLGILLGSTKLVYCILAFSSLIFFWNRPAGLSRGKWLGMLLMPGILGIAAAVVWLKLPDPSLFYLGNGAQPAGQIAYALQHPLEFLQTLYNTIANPGHALSFVAMGFPVPEGMNAVSWYGVILGGLIVSTPGIFSPKQRVILLMVVLAALCASVLPTYLTYTPVGHREILGIQGRYFIPIAIFALVAAGFSRNDWFFMRRVLRIGLGVAIPLLLLVHFIDLKS